MRGDKTLEVQAVVLGEKLAETELECNNLRTANARLKAEWSNAQEEIRKLQKDHGITPQTKLEERKGLDSIADLCLALEKKAEAILPSNKENMENDGRIDLIFESLQKVDAKLRQKFDRENHTLQEGKERPKALEKALNFEKENMTDKVEKTGKNTKPPVPKTSAVARAIEQFQQKANAQPDAKGGYADGERRGGGRPPIPIKRNGTGFPPQFARKDPQAASSDGPSKEAMAELDTLKKEKEDALKKMKELMLEVKKQEEQVIEVQGVSDSLSEELKAKCEENKKMLAETEQLKSMVEKYSKAEEQIRKTLNERVGSTSEDIAEFADALKAYDEQVQEQLVKIQGRERELDELKNSLEEKSSKVDPAAEEKSRLLEAEIQELREKVAYYKEEIAKQQNEISRSKQEQLDLSKSLKELKDLKDRSVSGLEQDLSEYKKKVSESENVAQQSRAELATIKSEKQELAAKCQAHEKEMEELKRQCDELATKSKEASTEESVAKQAQQEQSIRELMEKNSQLSAELKSKQDELQAIAAASTVKLAEAAPLAAADEQTCRSTESEAQEELQEELKELNEALQEMLVKNMALQEKLSAHQTKLDIHEKQEREIKLLLSKYSDSVWSPTDSSSSTLVVLSNLLAEVDAGDPKKGTKKMNESTKQALKPKDINRMQSQPGANQGSDGAPKTDGKQSSGHGAHGQEALVVSEVPMQENLEDLVGHPAGKTKSQHGRLFRMLSGTSGRANKNLEGMKANTKNAQERLRENEVNVQALKNEMSRT